MHVTTYNNGMVRLSELSLKDSILASTLHYCRHMCGNIHAAVAQTQLIKSDLLCAGGIDDVLLPALEEQVGCVPEPECRAEGVQGELLTET